MKKVKRIWLVISALLAFAAAGGVFYFSYTAYDRLVATTEVVVAAEDIEPYTVITSDRLRLKEMPRAILDEEIYVSEEDVAGRIAISRIPAEAMIYRPLAVAPSRFRYVSDPELEVVSILRAPWEDRSRSDTSSTYTVPPDRRDDRRRAIQ